MGVFFVSATGAKVCGRTVLSSIATCASSPPRFPSPQFKRTFGVGMVAKAQISKKRAKEFRSLVGGGPRERRKEKREKKGEGGGGDVAFSRRTRSSHQQAGAR